MPPPVSNPNPGRASRSASAPTATGVPVAAAAVQAQPAPAREAVARLPQAASRQAIARALPEPVETQVWPHLRALLARFSRADRI